MCRNIKTLYNFVPPATDQEIKAAALQYVKKISGFQKPSEVNLIAFETAIDEISAASKKLINGLSTSAAPKNREEEARQARIRSDKRFGRI